MFIRFKALVEKFFSKPIKTLYSDNGGEYDALASFLTINGVSHLTSPPHTPEHNGFAERRHRHIVETGLSLLSHACMPPEFWTYAFTTACYLINRLPTPTLSHKSPFFCLFGNPPNYLKLCSFGCLCYPWLKPYSTHKLDPKSKPCIFIGYSKTQSAYHCLDVITKRIYTSRHVSFVENDFPYSRLSHSTISLLESPDPNQWCPLSLSILSPTSSPTPPLSPTTHVSSSPPISTPLSQHHDTPASSSSTITQPTSPANQPVPTTNPTHGPPPISLPPTGIITRSKHNIHKPNPKYAHLTTTQPRPHEPTTIAQALKDPLWRQAMEAEMASLHHLGTWDLVPPTHGKNLVKCKWVYRIKYKPNGDIERYKARLVAKGFQQRPGLDYNETFSPVVRPATIRTLLSLAVTNNWSLRQLDINNAFLQGTLQEEVYMAQPPGYIDTTFPTHVCKLKKAIYGLKQAPRAWYTELTTFLLGKGFKRAVSDASLFILHHSKAPVYLIVYVDDIIITGPNASNVDLFIQSLACRFSLKDLGTLSYFLGVEVTPTVHGLFLNQRKYIIDLLGRLGMADAKPSPTPMVATQTLRATSGTVLEAPTAYRAALGGLQYLTLTRPDVAFAVNKLSQFMHRPTTDHWSALKRLMRYLCGTLEKGITIFRDSPSTLHAFSDADWAGDKDDYLSTMGYVLFLGRNPITWASKKQKSLARSSTEAEYRAVATTTAELLWVRNLLHELNIPVTHTPVIYCDNLSATFLSSNPIFSSKMKHLALAFHFIREQVRHGTMRVSHVSTGDQLADFLTKPLSRPRLDGLLSKIGLIDNPSVLRGHVKDKGKT